MQMCPPQKKTVSPYINKRTVKRASSSSNDHSAPNHIIAGEFHLLNNKQRLFYYVWVYIEIYRDKLWEIQRCHLLVFGIEKRVFQTQFWFYFCYYCSEGEIMVKKCSPYTSIILCLVTLISCFIYTDCCSNSVCVNFGPTQIVCVDHTSKDKQSKFYLT